MKLSSSRSSLPAPFSWSGLGSLTAALALLAGCNSAPQILTVGDFEISHSSLTDLLSGGYYPGPYFEATPGQLLTFTVTAQDADGDALSWAVGPLPNGASFDPESLVFSWTPTELDAAEYSYQLNIVVRDEGGGWDATGASIVFDSYGGDPGSPPDPK